jgi:hypothetical protein
VCVCAASGDQIQFDRATVTWPPTGWLAGVRGARVCRSARSCLPHSLAAGVPNMGPHVILVVASVGRTSHTPALCVRERLATWTRERVSVRVLRRQRMPGPTIESPSIDDRPGEPRQYTQEPVSWLDGRERANALVRRTRLVSGEPARQRLASRQSNTREGPRGRA